MVGRALAAFAAIISGFAFWLVPGVLLAGAVSADENAELSSGLYYDIPALLSAPPASAQSLPDEPEAAPSLPAPPVLLRPDTPPAPLLPPLIPEPVLAVREPLPTRQATSCIQRDEQGRLLGWMDRQQCVFSGRTLATAVWFDDLFGDWSDNQATMLLRAITEMTTTDAEGTGFRFRLRASAALPNATKRLRLVISDDSDADESVAGQDIRSQLQSTRDQVSAALRWIPFESAGIETDFDIGVRGLGPPDIFVRGRLRKSWGISQDSALRFGETLRYGSESLGRSITQLDYEYAFGNTALARLSSAYEYQQENRDKGFTWAHGVSMSHALGAYRSLGYGYSLNGHTRPNWKGDSYGPWMLYRSNWLRPWLFYELEPRLTRYRDQVDDSVLSLTLRLEIQLGKK